MRRRWRAWWCARGRHRWVPKAGWNMLTLDEVTVTVCAWCKVAQLDAFLDDLLRQARKRKKQACGKLAAKI